MGRRKATEEAPFRQFHPADSSQFPIFRKIVKIEGLPAQTAILISYVPRGRGSGLIIVPRPLIRFGTHPR